MFIDKAFIYFSAASISIAPVAVPASAADWQAVEQIKTYAITGKTGIDLYRSIGDKGPQAGVQAIAHTSFKLTWTRNTKSRVRLAPSPQRNPS